VIRWNWNEVWESGACQGADEADRRKQAKAANDVPEESGGDDMFAQARPRPSMEG
jgi:hypothetical protein